MSQLAGYFWIYIALSFGVGILTGFLTWKSQGEWKWSQGWLVWGLIVFVLGVLAAALKLLPGRNGMYLELALFFFAAFVVGCWLGGLIRGLFAPAEKKLGVDEQPAVDSASRKTESAPDRAVTATTNDAALQPAAPANLSSGAVGGTADHQSATADSKSGAGNQKSDAVEKNVAAPVSGIVTAVSAAAPLAAISGAVNQPVGLSDARDGGADDLKKIKGIGPKNEKILNQLGIFHFDQIVTWTSDNVQWVDDYLKFHGRIAREDWIGQARKLAAGQETEFSQRVASGEIESSRRKS